METNNKPYVLTDAAAAVLSIDGAAKRYPGLTPSAIRRLVKSGEIPSRKIGVKFLVTPEAIETWLYGSSQPTQTEAAQGIRRLEV